MSNIHEMIRQAADDDLEYEIKYLPRYSGRGMYGRSCLALVSDSIQELYTALVYSIEMNKDEDILVSEILYDLQPKFDSMGTGYVMYFPGVIAEEEDDQES